MIPDGDFELLPLDLLLTERPESAEVVIEDRPWFISAPWLARAWEITLAPSVSAALAIRRQGLPAARAPEAGGIFGLANPHFVPTSDQAYLPPSRSSCSLLAGAQAPIVASKPPRFQDLPPLTELAPFLRKAAERWPPAAAMTAVGPDATEAYLWRHRDALASAAVVFFGTHGLRGQQDLAKLDQPALALTPGGAATTPDGVALDGLLKADEIAVLRLQASLVILAACNSSAADERAGEATFSGLPRALLAAGARNVVMSHWMAKSSVATSMFSNLLAPDRITAPAAELHAARFA